MTPRMGLLAVALGGCAPGDDSDTDPPVSDTGDAASARVSSSPTWSLAALPAASGFGQAMAYGDLNHDGTLDVVVSAPFESADRGGVYLYAGGANGLGTTAAWSFNTATAVDTTGGKPRIGRAVAVGRFNSDSWDDLAIGVPGGECTGCADESGLVAVFFGTSGGFPSTTPSVLLSPGSGAEKGFHNLGDTLAAGDFDGDGDDDLLVGAPAYASTNAAAYRPRAVAYAAPIAAGATPAFTDEFYQINVAHGVALGVADVNGDGRDDALLAATSRPNGTTGHEGRANLRLGVTGGNLLATAVAWSVNGPTLEANLGRGVTDSTSGVTRKMGVGSVAGAGDVNGDGYEDVLLGAPETDASTGKGWAALFLGGPNGPGAAPAQLWNGSGVGHQLGAVVAPAGDVNNDGYDDIVYTAVGETSGSNYTGFVHLWHGAPIGVLAQTVAAEYVIGPIVPRTGIGVLGLPSRGDTRADLNNDGRADLLVAALGNSSGSSARIDLYTGQVEPDADADGAPDFFDCADNNAAIRPSATEVAIDNVDQNCDGREICYEDLDDDDYGNTSETILSVDADCYDAFEAMYIVDCDDSDPDVHTNATELVGDEVDSDCSYGSELCYRDLDGDDHGVQVVASSDTDCKDPGEGHQYGDCDDNNSGRYVGAAEIAANGADDDCDGVVDEGTCYPDADADTYGETGAAFISATGCVDENESNRPGDCDDGNATVRPGGAETVGDNVDGDCNGAEQCYHDADGDGVGSSSVITSADTDCNDSGESKVSGDCAPTDKGRFPGNAEIANDGIDQDCDGKDATAALCFVDNDGDGFGTSATVIDANNNGCADKGESAYSTDCNDSSAAIKPGGVEIVGDSVDQDCNGGDLCYDDKDGDRFGSTTTRPSSNLSCADAGESKLNTDCNDGSAAIFPGADEIIADRKDQDCDNADSCYLDADKDGHGAKSGALVDDPGLDGCVTAGEATVADDCNDALATAWPGATEIMGDLVDQDCDGSDECYLDLDGDEYGVALTVSDTSKCADANRAVVSGDCNDADKGVHPGATEVPGDQVDQSCDGQELCYRDLDGDAAAGNTTVVSLDADCVDAGEFTQATDCVDSNAAIRPGVTEVVRDGVDQDCDGFDACYQDTDRDGHGIGVFVPDLDKNGCATPGEAVLADDCNDGASAVYPGAVESPADSIDQDCNGAEVCYRDTDADSFGSALTVASLDLDCSDAGEADDRADCDDASAQVHPAASEVPGNGKDENCDGADGCFTDADDDGYGTVAMGSGGPASCEGSGVASVAGDCDDAHSDVHPGADETAANGTDEDCDGVDDCYGDRDQDGFGAGKPAPGPGLSCIVRGYSAVGDDCDDADADVNPDATETIADEADADCDGFESCYRDLDLDGFGVNAVVVSSDLDCDDDGESLVTGDCDDGRADTFPGAPDDAGDGRDADCDGAVSCFLDGDGDGFGAGATGISADGDCADVGEAALAGDCNDYRADVRPLGVELPGNNTDEDCDGRVACYVDVDRDGFGGPEVQTVQGFTCAIDGLSSQGGDCADDDPARRPGVAEIVANGIDEDCSGFDECYRDLDLDGAGVAWPAGDASDGCDDPGEATAADDCDDEDADVPGAEVPDDHIDQDCDGLDACYADLDGDGFGDDEAELVANPLTGDCGSDPGVSDVGNDCDDAFDSVYPGAAELPGDGIDQDCDGTDKAATSCYADLDGDGFGGEAAPSPLGCHAVGFAPIGGDCDDADAKIYPGAAEALVDGIDQDCDGGDRCFADADGDGHGSLTLVDGPLDCLGGGAATTATDCDDQRAVVFTGNPEVCDGLDNDCDGVRDEDFPYSDPRDPTCEPAVTPLCGCQSTTGTSPGFVAGLVIALVLGRRRRC